MKRTDSAELSSVPGPTGKKKLRPPRFVAAGRSRDDIRISELAEHVMSSTGGSVSAENLARAAESLLVEQIGGDVVAHARKLLDQQFWLWGQDIARLSKNGLIDFGFERHAAPTGLQSSSFYALDEACGRRVGLWGFGAFYGQANVGGLFLKRYRFGPCITTSERPPRCWAFDQWPGHHPPVTSDDRGIVRQLLDGFLIWVVEYERWIDCHAPRGHRAGCLRDWKKRCCGPNEIADEWTSIRKHVLGTEPDKLLDRASA